MFNSIRLWIHQTFGECAFDGVSVKTTEGKKRVYTIECSHELCSKSVRKKFHERDLSYPSTTSGRMQSLSISGLSKPSKPKKLKERSNKSHDELLEDIFVADAVMNTFEVSEPEPEPERYSAPEPDYSSVRSNSQDDSYSSVSSNTSSSYDSGGSSDSGGCD